MDVSFVRLTKTGQPGPDNRRVYCNHDGVFIGPGCALIRAETDSAGRKSYTPRPRSEIAHLLEAGYGFHFGLDALMSRLDAIAKALDDGNLALAWIGALQLGLPELPDNGAVNRMAAADRLLKYGFNPDEPRDWHGRWTTDGSADADPQPQLLRPAHYSDTDPRRKSCPDAIIRISELSLYYAGFNSNADSNAERAIASSRPV